MLGEREVGGGDGVASGARRRFVGLVVPAAQVAVRARVDGLISRFVKHPGDRVEAGDTVAFVDDSEAALEWERQRAKAAGIAHRADAARADLRLLEQRAEQLRSGQEKRAAAAFEVAQSRSHVEAAAARLKALEEEGKEAEIECRAIERRRQNYRCVAPLSGEVAEAPRSAGEYVRAGETVLKIQSLRRQVRLNLAADLSDRLPALEFRLAGPGPRDLLSLSNVRAQFNLNGGRSVALEVPDGLAMAIGMTVDVEVALQPQPEGGMR
jgi:multidrug efflux pump subunit AcrA (membrane-fusion protein)